MYYFPSIGGILNLGQLTVSNDRLSIGGTATVYRATVLPESGASDSVTGIDGAVAGQIIMLRPQVGTDTITLTGGEFVFTTGTTFQLTLNSLIVLMRTEFNTTQRWVEIGRIDQIT